MASSKLSDADKQIILDLYRQPEETTSTLAERYGVSNSTISRVLKQNLPADEYSQLIQQKRSGATATASAAPKAPPPKAPVSAPSVVSDKAPPKPKASKAAAVPELELEPEAAPEPPSGVPEKAPPKPKVVIKSPPPEPEPQAPPTPAAPIRRRSTVAAVPDEGDEQAEPAAVTAWEDDETDDTDDLDVAGLEDVDGLEDEDYGDDEDLEDDEDDEDWTGPTLAASPRQEQLEILPFDEAAFQRTCYLVVDRLAELITCPLRDFSDLGQIPKEEEQARTLPVFDNHRIARRFSRRNQRVIKVPDASILQKTQPYLQAKGITRLLINGQVYALYE